MSVLVVAAVASTIPLLPIWLAAVIAGVIGGALCKGVMEAYVESHLARENSSSDRDRLNAVEIRTLHTASDIQQLAVQLEESIPFRIQALQSELNRLVSVTSKRNDHLAQELDSVQKSVAKDLRDTASGLDERLARLESVASANKARLQVVEELAAQISMTRGRGTDVGSSKPKTGLSLPPEISLATAIGYLREVMTLTDEEQLQR